MIIDKTIPEDAPPAYEDTQQQGPSTGGSSEKRRSFPTLAAVSPANAVAGFGAPAGPAPTQSAWWPFGQQSKTEREIKKTVLGLVSCLPPHCSMFD